MCIVYKYYYSWGAVHVDETLLVQEVPVNMLDVALLPEGRRCRPPMRQQRGTREAGLGVQATVGHWRVWEGEVAAV